MWLSNIKLPRKRIQVLAICWLILVTTCGLIFSSNISKVSAGYDDMNTYLNDFYDQYISLIPNDPSTGKGNHTPSFRFVLYTSNNNASGSVVIQNISTRNKPQCSDFDIDQATLLDGDSSTEQGWPDGQSQIGTPRNVPDCSDTSNGFVLSNLDRFSNSVRFPGYSATVVRLALKSGKPSVFVDARTRYDYPDDRLSYIGANTTPSQQQNGQLYSSNGVSLSIPDTSFGSTIISKFAPPCNTNGDRAFVWWKDADSNKDANDNKPVNFELREYPNGYGGGYRPLDSGDAGNGGASFHTSFIPKARAKYEIRFTGVLARGSNSANTIKIWAPFDSGAAFVDCPPPPAASLGACNNMNVHFSLGSNGVNVRVYARTSNDGNPFDEPIVYNKNHKATANLDIDKDVGIDKLLSNNGWWVLVKPLNSAGNPTGGNTEGGPNSTHRNVGSGQCWSATCSAQIVGNIPGNGQNSKVIAGSRVTAILTIHNNGSNQIPKTLNGAGSLAINSDAGPGYIANPNGVYPNSSDFAVVEFNAPAGRGVHSFNAYPDMYGKFPLGPACPVNYSTYQQFINGENFSITEDDVENPTKIEAQGTISRTGGTTDAPLQGGTLQLKRASTGQVLATAGVPAQIVNPTANVGPATFDAPSGVRSLGWTVGEDYCYELNYSFRSGWWGPGGNADIAAGVPGSAGDCHKVTNRPYVSVYGNDVSAGGAFATQDSGACDVGSNQAKIEAYTKSNGAGSGTQLAALALGEITGFKSAFLRTTSTVGRHPYQPIGLTFGNDPSSGNYQQVNCATDYFGTTMLPEGSTKRDDISTSGINLSSVGSGKQTVIQGEDNRLTISGGSGFSQRHTIYVDGDVYIQNDIAYINSGGWASIGSIPYFVLVAKGNIYIDRSVSQLDGVYVAQPKDDGSKGEIFTCATGFNPIGEAGTTLWNNCGGAAGSAPRLIIHGSFVARAVHFLRTLDTLSDGALAELANNSRAAEVFEFSPELYLAEPVLRPSGTSTTGEYDYITTLPPIL